jgi:predicted LPLAT superfamily acyltransferase
MASSGIVTARQGAWLAERETGSSLGIRGLLWVTKLFGRTGAHAVLRFVAFYYALFGRLVGTSAYRCSQDFLRRLFPEVGFWLVYRHILTFAQCSLDRIFFASGETESFEISRNGSHHLEQALQHRRGAILLGAHLGSFEVMRAISRNVNFPINIVAHFENARRITAFLQAVAPDFRGRVIEIDPSAPHFMLAVKERVEAGELVAILGDRTGLGETSVEATFLGSKARFPAGPFLLASVLQCPVLLTFGLYHPPRRYALYCEPFADRLELPRAHRKQALRDYVQQYASRLEYYCRLAPLNWFNFFRFWEDEA